MRIVLVIGLAILSASSVFADDRIWLENTKIDGKAVKMIFDSGASSIALTKQAVKRLGLKVVVPPTNGVGDTASYSAEIDGQPFRTDFNILNIPALIPDFDGVMGWRPLSRGIYRIDAEADTITPFSGIPDGIKRWGRLFIDTNAETLVLKIPGQQDGKNIISIDTGDSSGISLTPREWKRWKKTHPHNPITLRAYLTLDGCYAGEESWADQIQIGPLTLNDVPVMEEGPSTKIEFGSERDVVGLTALRRMDLMVDGIHGVAYMRAKQTPPPPYSYNRLGAVFIPTATDSNDLVGQIVPGSPAYRAGIRNGDILLKIDGRSVSGWTNGWRESNSDAFSMPAGTRLDLTLRRRRKIFETAAVLQEILQPSHRKYNPSDDFPGKSELDAESYYSSAMECEIRGDSNGALTNYGKAIETNPDFGDAYSRRGYLEQSNDPDAALADYGKAIDLGAGTAEDYGDRGMVEQGKGYVADALADYGKAIELEPDLAEVYAYRGWLEQRTNQFDAAAIADYEKALHLNPELIWIKPDLAQIYGRRACREEQAERLDAALADLNRAIELEPDLAEAYANRGWVEQRTNEFDAAIADYENALRLKPDLTTAKTNVVQIYGDRGYQELEANQFDAALADYNKVIELEPGFAEAYSYRGFVEKTMGKLDAALADDNKAIQLDPASAWLYGNRSTLEVIKGDLDRAEADCAEAARLDPKMAGKAAQAFHVLGDSRFQRLEYTNALTDFRKACELNPTDDYAHFGVWLCSSSLGSSERATADLKAYLSVRGAKDPGDWPSEVGQFLVGQITEEVLVSAAESADDKKDKDQHCEAYYYVGAKRLFAGDKKGAASEFRKCLATDVQNFNEYRFAKAELQMLEKVDGAD
ncbi:MAG TPA: tetratricopeptide repeat protein [Candidatus Sulfotelmatobacter sp.]|nr:tetratricopeptide repeat protein [Candidatus Sulfotelmatobacter sp.]